MSLRYEQYRALKMTQDFLRKINNSYLKDLNKRELQDEARRCLHHFPFLHDNGQPIWSRDEFTKDYE